MMIKYATRRKHFLESFIDIGTGYLLAVVMQILIFPLFGIHTSYNNMFIIGAIFMSVSCIRSWIWRMFFHWRWVKQVEKEQHWRNVREKCERERRKLN